MGLELGKTSIGKILHPEAVDFSPVSVAILAASILVKLWMGHFNRTLGKKLGSAAMAATAADSLSDVVATSAVLAGTLAGHFAHLSIDGWAGAVVAVFILKAGWGAAKDTINPLLGASPDPELVHAIREVVLSHPQVVGMHDLIIHDYGPGRRLCSFHAEVPQDADILEAHDAIDHIERFIGILTEHFAGKFPTWMAPVQVKVLPVSDKSMDYAKTVYAALRAKKIRCELDDRNEKIGYKIREARQVDRVPYMLILGGQEVENNTVSVRDRATDQTVTCTLDEFIAKISKEIADRV